MVRPESVGMLLEADIELENVVYLDEADCTDWWGDTGDLDADEDFWLDCAWIGVDRIVEMVVVVVVVGVDDGGDDDDEGSLSGGDCVPSGLTGFEGEELGGSGADTRCVCELCTEAT